MNTADTETRFEEQNGMTVPADDHAAAARARNARVRRNLLLLSLANWFVAILAWSISAWLGITSPASIFVYTILFVIGLFAAIVAIATYLLEKFAHRPESARPDANEGEHDAAAPSVS